MQTLTIGTVATLLLAAASLLTTSPEAPIEAEPTYTVALRTTGTTAEPVQQAPAVAFVDPDIINHRAERLGIIRLSETTSRIVRLVRCEGTAGTCALTTQQAKPGDRWVGVDGASYVKQQDGTWVRHREPAIAATVDAPTVAAPAATTVAYRAPTRCDLRNGTTTCVNGVCTTRTVAAGSTGTIVGYTAAPAWGTTRTVQFARSAGSVGYAAAPTYRTTQRTRTRRVWFPRLRGY